MRVGDSHSMPRHSPSEPLDALSRIGMKFRHEIEFMLRDAAPKGS